MKNKTLHTFTGFKPSSGNRINSLPETIKIVAKTKRDAQEYLQSQGYLEVRWCSEQQIIDIS